MASACLPSRSPVHAPFGPALVRSRNRRLAATVVDGSSAGAAGLDVARQLHMLDVNVRALVVLTQEFLPGMAARGRGAIVNVASTAGFQPAPFMAAHGASQVFVLSYTEALWAEARGSAVRIVAVSPGTTQTEFSDLVGAPDESVVAGALGQLDRWGPTIVSGWRNAVQSRVPSRVGRRSVLALVVRSTMRPTDPDQR